MSELPERWDPRKVALNRDKENPFLLRPGQILVGPGDEKDAQSVLTGWKPLERKTFGVTTFTRTPQNPEDPAREVLEAIARVRKATSNRPRGPVRIAPNHVLVGEAGGPITLSGEPRLQGGPGSSVRLAKRPKSMPLRTTRRGDGKGVRIAVLDTGMFDHDWLAAVQRAPGSGDIWDVEPDQYADAESGHGTFIAGLILQVAPAAEVYVVKVLDSHGVGDDATVALAMEQLPQDVDIVNLSLGGYTDDDSAPLAIACALQIMRKQRSVVVAAAGNNASDRPFWPGAFKQVLAVGAVEQKNTQWLKADFSNYGYWVDAAARGVNLESTFNKAKTKAAQGDKPDPSDPTLTFDGWAAWDGTSFASPITAGVLARTMSRNGFATAEDAKDQLLSISPPAPQPVFPLAVLVDELLP
jgi:subtilisin family serine protease